MEDKLKRLKNEAKEAIEKIIDSQTLNEIRTKYLGKKSEISSVLKDMASISAEERPIIGNL